MCGWVGGRAGGEGRVAWSAVCHARRLMCFCLPRRVRYQLSNGVSILAQALACVCALVLGFPPPPRRQAARGCKADRLRAPSVRAGAVCVQRLGLVLGLGHAEGFVRRVQGVRRSWPSERYIGAQRRSSLEQKSWVEILVIRQRAACRVQRAGCRVQRAGCRVQGAACSVQVQAGCGGERRGPKAEGRTVHEALRPNPNPDASP